MFHSNITVCTENKNLFNGLYETLKYMQQMHLDSYNEVFVSGMSYSQQVSL